MNGYLQAWRRYATFRGRATRREFWGFLLLHVLAILLISFLERQFAIANPEIGMGIWVFADQCGCNRAFSGSGGRKLAMTLSLRYSSSRYP